MARLFDHIFPECATDFIPLLTQIAESSLHRARAVVSSSVSQVASAESQWNGGHINPILFVHELLQLALQCCIDSTISPQNALMESTVRFFKFSFDSPTLASELLSEDAQSEVQAFVYLGFALVSQVLEHFVRSALIDLLAVVQLHDIGFDGT
jgi:hypothetical protein